MFLFLRLVEIILEQSLDGRWSFEEQRATVEESGAVAGRGIGRGGGHVVLGCGRDLSTSEFEAKRSI